jgi:hypothetical protein
MAGQEQFQAESLGRDEIVSVESDEVRCIDYEPGMLGKDEDELNELRDTAFVEEFLCGCSC